MMLKYVKGYIFEGHTFVVNKSDIHNAKDEQFAEGTALMPDGWISVKDRLPKDDEAFVVAYSPRSERLNKTMIMKGKNLKTRAKLGWSTYWIPIPEPPKGDDED